MIKMIIVPIFALMLGCTSPTQPIAERALDAGTKQEHTIISDLAAIAKQSAVDKGVADAIAAVKNQDVDAAKTAVENAVTQFDKIGWLQIQHERARALLRMGQTFVWSQEGIFDIMIGEFQESKKRSDNKDNTE